MRASRDVAARQGAPERRRRPELAVVPHRAPRGRLGFLLGSFVLVSLLVVGVVVLQILASQSAFRFEALTKHANDLRIQQRELTLHVAELEAPDRIKKAAEKLGLRLVPLGRMQTIVVRTSGPGGPPTPSGERP